MYGQHCLFFLFLARNIYELYWFLGNLLCFSTLRSMASGNIHPPAIVQAYPDYLSAFCLSRCCEARGDPRSMKPPSSIQEKIPCENWRMVEDQLWFLGDDSELKAMLHELPSREFQRDFVPKEIRGSCSVNKCSPKSPSRYPSISAAFQSLPCCQYPLF